jgi:CRP-like cAMP-binding protein
MLSTLEKILFLRQIDIFAEFSARELGTIAQKSQEVGFSKGEVIFLQGDPGDALYLVIGGKVRVIREDGGSKETIAILEERSCFGEMAILSDQTRTATIEAADSLTLLKIKKDDFRDLILQKPDMAFPIFRILIRRLQDVTDKYMQKQKEKEPA